MKHYKRSAQEVLMVKDTNLTIRMTKEHKELITKEAHKLGISASNFILMSCIKAINSNTKN